MEGLGRTSERNQTKSQGAFPPGSQLSPSPLPDGPPKAPGPLCSPGTRGWWAEAGALGAHLLVPGPWPQHSPGREFPVSPQPHHTSWTLQVCSASEGWVRSGLRTVPSPKKVSPPSLPRPGASQGPDVGGEGSHPSLPRSSPRQRRAVKVRVVALPLMVPSRAGDIRDPRAHRTDRRTWAEVQARWRTSQVPSRKRKSPTLLTCSPCPVEPSRDSRLRSLPDHVSLTRPHPKTRE